MNRIRRFILDTENVAFHALLGGGKTGDHNVIGQILVFDQTMLNIGGAYNNNTGIFVTPVEGIYILSISLTAENSVDGHNHVDIMKNGEEIAAAYSSGTVGLDQGSVTVVMHLVIGDEIHVSTQRHDVISLYGDKLTSFMGCLILPL